MCAQSAQMGRLYDQISKMTQINDFEVRLYSYGAFEWLTGPKILKIGKQIEKPVILSEQKLTLFITLSDTQHD